MTDRELTAIRLGKWTPGMKCGSLRARRAPEFDTPSITGIAWQCVCGAVLRNLADQDDHDVPCPPLTSDDISEWLRKEGIAHDVCAFQLGFHAYLYPPLRNVIVGLGPTMLAALENAVAKLPEAKE